MKDVGGKPETLRTARASARLYVPAHCLELMRTGETEKGDPLATARIAGILAAKRTDEILPLCHPLPLQRADVRFELTSEAVDIRAEVETIGPTGVEMEALTAAAVAGLTLYDMLKPYAEPPELTLTGIKLDEKTGGKSEYPRYLDSPVPAAVIELPGAEAGDAVAGALSAAGFGPLERIEPGGGGEALTAALERRLAGGPGLIVTLGGTGPAGETAARVSPFLTTELPGLMETARAFGQRRRPQAMLSQGVAGLAGESLIVTLPGDAIGADDSLAALLPGLVQLFAMRSG